MIRIEEVLVNVPKNTMNLELLGKSYFQKKLRVRLLRNSPRDNKGVPDYKYQIDDKIFFIEFKSNHDGVKQEQLDWMLKHPDEDISVIWVKNSEKEIDIINEDIPIAKYSEEIRDDLNHKKHKFKKDLLWVFRTFSTPQIYTQKVTQFLLVKGWSNKEIRMYYQELLEDGEIFEPKQGYVQLL